MTVGTYDMNEDLLSILLQIHNIQDVLDGKRLSEEKKDDIRNTLEEMHVHVMKVNNYVKNS